MCYRKVNQMKRLLLFVVIALSSNLYDQELDKEAKPFEIVQYYFVDLITNPD